MQRISLTPKQHFILRMANRPEGVCLRGDPRVRNRLLRGGLVAVSAQCGTWHTTTKGRAVLEVIDTGDVVMFNT